jgi:chorismate-pyruvate lyase
MGDLDGLSEATRDAAHGDLLASALTPSDELAQRHFVLQDRRPEHFGEIDLAELEPFLRGLLFTDGTVTRTLEVQTLSPVSVEVTDQTDIAVSGQIAEHLDVSSGTESVRRRVLIGTGEPTEPVIWAESHILPSRLPSGFLNVLQGAPDGIGESLQQVELESWREMLWFGVDLHPAWSGVDSHLSSPVITRLYRVITNGLPALLISESFSVTLRDGAYRLDCVGRTQAEPNSSSMSSITSSSDTDSRSRP